MDAGAPAPCASCGRPLRDGETADAAGWCPACRAAVVRAAHRRALAWAAGVAAAYLVAATLLGAWTSPFLAGVLGAGALLTLAVHRVARRAAFDLIRNRGARAARDPS